MRKNPTTHPLTLSTVGDETKFEAVLQGAPRCNCIAEANTGKLSTHYVYSLCDLELHKYEVKQEFTTRAACKCTMINNLCEYTLRLTLNHRKLIVEIIGAFVAQAVVRRQAVSVLQRVVSSVLEDVRG